MMIKRDLIIAVLATFCVAAALFRIMPINGNPYDPKADVDSDGKIDGKDIAIPILPQAVKAKKTYYD